MYFFCLIVIEQGDDIQKIINEKTLVIANHQSTGDVPILMTSFNAKPNVLPNLMWIMDRLFKLTNFGIVSILHQDFFIVSVSINSPSSQPMILI
jgi:lysophosphatidylglycerol acyltransferase 1